MVNIIFNGWISVIDYRVDKYIKNKVLYEEMDADVITLDERGYVASGEDCLTNAEGIFVAGDCRTKKIRQVATAASDGAVAALAACSYLQ